MPTTLESTGRVVKVETAEPSLGALLKCLAEQAGDLARQEAALAQGELRQSVRSTSRGVALLVAGALLLCVGGLAFTAFLILSIGALIGTYWPVALAVAVLYVVVGVLLALRAKSVFKQQTLLPEDTLRSLAADRQWARAKLEEAKRRLA